ncbi:hypothetical protein A6A26_04900 [Pantoea sp. OXWO6B1]|nr:hypothetical protein A6A26_04900 [Pantoea sp. OXWO6B1]
MASAFLSLALSVQAMQRLADVRLYGAVEGEKYSARLPRGRMQFMTGIKKPAQGGFFSQRLNCSGCCHHRYRKQS